jgi:transposase
VPGPALARCAAGKRRIPEGRREPLRWQGAAWSRRTTAEQPTPVEVLAAERHPARRTHANATHQDGRKLRRYRHRWIVERTFAWLGHFRRLVVRYERLLATYSGFFHLACAMLTLRRVLK